MIKEGVPPILNKSVRVLILGSLPSDESIRQEEYYAKPSNDFWKLISKTIGEDITGLEYEDKLSKLQENGIGLWDVFHRASREGSLDSKIKQPEMNDFSGLRDIAPSLKLICFNGKKAREHEDVFHNKGFKTKVLLSSSGANRSNSAKRDMQWESLLSYMESLE